MKLVLHLSHSNWSAPTTDFGPLLAEVGALAEEAGFDGIATADHLWQHPIMGGPEANCLEAYTTLAFLAAHTRSVRLLTVVTGAHFRHPALLAKTVTTLDVLSGGRAWLGLGAGHYQEECDGLGLPFPSLTTRYELLEDALEVLRRSCEEAGTDFDRIERTCAYAFAPDAGGPATAELLGRLEWLAGLGIDTVIGRVDGDDPRPAIELLGRHVIPAAADLESRRT